MYIIVGLMRNTWGEKTPAATEYRIQNTEGFRRQALDRIWAKVLNRNLALARLGTVAPFKSVQMNLLADQMLHVAFF